MLSAKINWLATFYFSTYIKINWFNANCNFLYKHERIGKFLQTFNGLKSLINLNSFLARDLGLSLLSVLLKEKQRVLNAFYIGLKNLSMLLFCILSICLWTFSRQFQNIPLDITIRYPRWSTGPQYGNFHWVMFKKRAQLSTGKTF